MVEIKSVKVDNWGVFFLQKLQNFFNKTDYCDLTLQFQDNSQLKVHRLVLSACTDYFNILEQQCEVIEDILIMPRDLQADVVVPIVNFMYTGTLEFEVSMYGRLLKTAKDMNMTVLLKLLEAHKRTVELPKTPSQPILLNKGANQRMNTYTRNQHHSGTPQFSQQRTYMPRKTAPVTKTPANKPTVLRSTPGSAAAATSLPASTSYLKRTLPEPVQLVARYANTSAATQKGPSRFDCSDDVILPDHFESSFDNISYESRPLITARQIIKEERDLDDDAGSSSFEQLRKGYTAIKRPVSPSYTASPPEKKPNLQDIMEFTEAERVRKEIVAEEFEGTEYIEDNFSNDDDEQFSQQTKIERPKNDKGPVVIKNESGNVNHAKIISEVLKKYPHLVKNNKNIKLKIMQKGNATQTQVVSSSPQQQTSPSSSAKPQGTIKSYASPATASSSSSTPSSQSTASSTSTATATPTTTTQAPKKIDSKTMHALIAKGAENMTGPWLCLKCGINGRPISIPSYKSFRRHLISVHREKIDPKLCEHCGWRSQNKPEMHYHILLKHNVKPPADVHFPKCNECSYVSPDYATLSKHRDEQHPKAKLNAHHCIYCNRTFSNEILVYAHMRNNHKERACEDGVMDFDEDEDGMDEEPSYVERNEPSTSDNKIKIISNIALPTKGIPYVIDAGAHTVQSIGSTIVQQSGIRLEPSSEAEGLTSVASGIATSLAVLDSNVVISNADEFAETDDHNSDQATETNILQTTEFIESAIADVHGEYLKKDTTDQDITRFVTEQGSSLELTASQKADLLQQLQDQRGVVMILNDEEFAQSQQIIGQEDGQNIVVVYSQAGGADTGKDDTTSLINTLATSQTVNESPVNIVTRTSGDNNVTNDEKNDEMDSTNPEDILIKMEDPDDESLTLLKKKTEHKLSTKTLISALEGDWSDDEMHEKTDEDEQKNKEHDQFVQNVKEESGDNVDDDEKEEKKLAPATIEKGITAGKDDSNSQVLRKNSTDSLKSKQNNKEKIPSETMSSRVGSESQSISRRSSKSESDDGKKIKKTDQQATAAAALMKNKALSVQKKRILEKRSDDKICSKVDVDNNKLEEDSRKNVDDKRAGRRKVTTDKADVKQTKSDLKTLINDWGDDEDDDDVENVDNA